VTTIKTEHREERLYTLAEDQGGYFTAADAKSVGYSHPLQHFHVRRGNWIREGRGIYRLRYFPLADRRDLIRWWLWSHKKGVISHESAADLYDLGDVMPARAHLTVPLNFRKKAEKGVVLYKAQLEPGEIGKREGVPLTTPIRTILDLARKHLEPDWLSGVVIDAVRKGLVNRQALFSILDKPPKWLDPATQVILRLAVSDA